MAGYPLTWLADVLRDAGCTVVEEAGWKTRGRDGSFTPRGVMMHHDASPAGETSDGVDVIRDGRPGLAGPLAQLWLAYDGTWHVVAAGRANHAGEGGPWGGIPRDQGNGYCIGIETDHTTNESWSGGQRSAALAGVAALADRLGIRTRDGLAEWFCAHKEYAAGRKPDPDPLDMDYAREQLLDYDGGDAPVQKIQKSTTEVRTLVNSEWRDLRFTTDKDDPTGTHAMGRGPLTWYTLTAQVYAEGDPGTIFYLRPYKDAGDDDETLHHQRSYVIAANGFAFVELTHGGNLGDGKYLRVQGKSAGSGITLTSTRGQLAGW